MRREHSYSETWGYKLRASKSAPTLLWSTVPIGSCVYCLSWSLWIPDSRVRGFCPAHVPISFLVLEVFHYLLIDVSYGGQGTASVSSFLPLCESQGRNAGHQAWQQAPVPTFHPVSYLPVPLSTPENATVRVTLAQVMGWEAWEREEDSTWRPYVYQIRWLHVQRFAERPMLDGALKHRRNGGGGCVGGDPEICENKREMRVKQHWKILLE